MPEASTLPEVNTFESTEYGHVFECPHCGYVDSIRRWDLVSPVKCNNCGKDFTMVDIGHMTQKMSEHLVEIHKRVNDGE